MDILGGDIILPTTLDNCLPLISIRKIFHLPSLISLSLYPFPFILSSVEIGNDVYLVAQTRILEWVAIPSSRGSSQSRDQTQVSHIAGVFFPSEPPGMVSKQLKFMYLKVTGLMFCKFTSPNFILFSVM